MDIHSLISRMKFEDINADDVLTSCGNLLLVFTERSEYSNEIIISNFSEQTTLEDLRIRFSLYGNIKNCYFFPNRIAGKQACITFYQTDSTVRTIKHGSFPNEIYLHRKKLIVCQNANILNMKKLHAHLQKRPGNTSINKLNDDCLLKIFDYLSILDKYKLRRVCIRWCAIAKMSLRTVRYLDLEMFTRDYTNLIKFDQEEFEQLKLFRNLNKLQIPKKSLLCYKKNPEIADGILTSLNMHFLVADFVNLNTLILRSSIYDENFLTGILTTNQKLKHIEIYYNQFITGKSLIYLSKNIHTFIVVGCRSIRSEYLRAALKRLKNLKCLRLVRQNVWNVLKIFNEYCDNLEILELDFSEGDPTTYNVFLSITNLKNLKDLKISNCNLITETFLVKLSNNCQELRRLKLDVTAIFHISKESMNAITSLTKLQNLSIRNIYCGRTNFANLRGLQKISFGNCDIREEQIVTIMQNSPELKCLKTYECWNITKNIFSQARMISASRCNNVTLELVSGKYIHRRCIIYNGKMY